MGQMTGLSYANSLMEEFKIHFQEKIDAGVLMECPTPQISKCVIFLSVGNPSNRAHVYKEIGANFEEAFELIHQRLLHVVKRFGVDPHWVKIDVVTDVEGILFEELEERFASTRRNYFRSGVAFDEAFKVAYLEQEINGNAMVRSVNKSPQMLHEVNINHYSKYNSSHYFPFFKRRYRNKPVYIFQTVAAFKDQEDTEIIDLHNGELSNGIRKITDIEEETKSLIEKSTYFLVDQVQEDGQFTYGYFAAFARPINTYNILRHSSTLYSMIEGYEQIQDEKILVAVEKGFEYLIREAIVYHNDAAFVVDHANHDEVKLGAAAAAVIAMSKYMEVTKTDKYLEIAQTLAKGLIQMKAPSGGFIHVLSYPSFEVKDLHRIIYYEGESVLAWLRLYAVDKNELWLEEAKKTFDYFIENDYWKHNDHWLSYAANELTLYEPEDEYFIFGLKNCNHRLNFMYRRETAYPTFLETMMAAYKMIGKIKELGKDELLEHIDVEFLNKAIETRASRQRYGFIYPEIAMYKKNPGLVLDGFFMRHHSFRVRIDDIEHYISGYSQFLQFYDFPKKVVN